MPFNWRTPYGYAIALFLQIVDVSSVLYCATLLFAFFIGSCWLCIVFVNDVANDLSSLVDQMLVKKCFFNAVQHFSDVKQLSMDFDSQSHRRWLKLVHRWVHSVHAQQNIAFLQNFSISLRRFVDDLSKIHEFIITGYFLWALFGICSSLLVVFLQLVEFWQF